MLSFADYIAENEEGPIKWHTKRIRFVGGSAPNSQKVHGYHDHMKLVKELQSMGYHPSIKQSTNGFFVDVKWSAPASVSFAQLLKKY